MFDKISALFQFFNGHFGLPTASIALIALALVLIFAILSVVLLVKLKGAREILHELGYDPPYDDAVDIIEQGNAQKSAQLEQRIVELEAEAGSKDADHGALQEQIKDLDDQLKQAHAETQKAAAQAGALTEAHRAAIEQLEQRIREKEAEGVASVAAAEQRWKELADQLQQSTLWNDKVTALANDQAQAHRTAMDQLEERMREMDAEHIADLTAQQRRTKELDDRLQQATLRNDQILAQANEQVQGHQTAVVELEQRIRQMESEGKAYLTALERHARELDDRLQQAVLEKEEIAAQASETEQAHQMAVVQLEERIRQLETEGMASMAPLEERSKGLEEQLRLTRQENEQVKAQLADEAQAHRRTIDQLDQRMREMEAESNANLAALEQRSKELDEQLQRAVIRHDRSAAEAKEQTQAYRQTVEKLETRIRQMEAEGIASMTALDQRSRELEEQLQQAHAENENLTAQAGEHAQSHHNAVEQFEQRLRQIEADGVASRDALEQRARELEEQLQQVHAQKEQVATQAGEQAQSHQNAVEQFEQRLRQIEADGVASRAALEQRARELEEQLQQANLRNENERSIAQQETLERNAGKEQLEQQIRDLEAERDAGEFRLKSLEAQVRELEGQLRQAANHAVEPKLEAAAGNGVVSTSEHLLRRAEWITACAVGAILPQGLVAAEAYASAALAANPQSIDASQLLAELARIRRAYPQGLPPVVESVTTFEERVAAFFATDLAHTADLADEEAQRRSRAGLNRSALLVANVALQLRQQSDAENSPAQQKLQELRDILLARLGVDAGNATGTAKFQSL